jgi:hypothetical protein
MSFLLSYVAAGAVVLGLVIFALAVLLGVYLVRLLKLPVELPSELHFAPPAPPVHPPIGHEQSRATAALQSRWSLIHNRARESMDISAALQDLAEAAKGSAAESVVTAAATRAQTAAKSADAGRAKEIDQAERETMQFLAEAKEAWSEAEKTFSPPARSQRLLIVMTVCAAILALSWTAIMILHHGSRAG